ncbi:MAG: preprotein translocase subunit SecD, partial [Planctomycetota bacterium]
ARSAQSTDLAPQFEIQVKLDAVGGAFLRRLTSTHLNQSLAIVVEGTIVTAPVIRSELGEDFVITGNFSKAAADNLAASIRKPDLRKRVTFSLRFADAKAAVAALNDEAARRKLRGFEATIDPRQNAIAITAADAETLEALRECLERLDKK